MGRAPGGWRRSGRWSRAVLLAAACPSLGGLPSPELPPAYGPSATSGRVGALDHQLIGIDHLIVGVRDLEAARAQYARLGFNSTPRGRHVGWGTANYCIMFEHDYLELLGIVDAGQFTNGLDRFLERARGAARAGAGQPRRRRRPAPPGRPRASRPTPPRRWAACWRRRAVPIELRFRNVILPRARHGRARPVRLRAPDAGADAPPGLARPPQRGQGDPLLHHRGLRRAPRWPTRCAGCSARPRSPRTDNVVAAHTGHGVILVAPPEDAMLMHPLLDLPDAAARADAGRPDAGGRRSRPGGGLPAAAGRARSAGRPPATCWCRPPRRTAWRWSWSAAER